MATTLNSFLAASFQTATSAVEAAGKRSSWDPSRCESMSPKAPEALTAPNMPASVPRFALAPGGDPGGEGDRDRFIRDRGLDEGGDGAVEIDALEQGLELGVPHECRLEPNVVLGRKPNTSTVARDPRHLTSRLSIKPAGTKEFEVLLTGVLPFMSMSSTGSMPSKSACSSDSIRCALANKLSASISNSLNLARVSRCFSRIFLSSCSICFRKRSSWSFDFALTPWYLEICCSTASERVSKFRASARMSFCLCAPSSICST
mmetsp:Transcript_83712/g.211009  ORF Transcript_83712/g.211009 Transcript_83712/m.211009 type:complete len:261 (-) Transcript_83712:1913-2695(-)